jgi:hypothetical protein
MEVSDVDNDLNLDGPDGVDDDDVSLAGDDNQNDDAAGDDNQPNGEPSAEPNSEPDGQQDDTGGEINLDEYPKYVAQFPDEFKKNKEFLDSIKDMKTLGDFAKAYSEARGKAAELGDVPEKPEDYGIDFPEDMPDYAKDYEALDGFLKGVHEAGLPQGVAKKVFDQYTEMQRQRHNAFVEHQKQSVQTAKEKLKQEWGDNYGEMDQFRQRAVRHFTEKRPGLKDVLDHAYVEIDGKMQRIGDIPEIVATLGEMGKMMAEAPFIPDDTDTGASGAAEATGDLGLYDDFDENNEF